MDHKDKCCCSDSSDTCCEHQMEEYDVVTLTLDDESTMECAVIDMFDFDDKKYMVLLPVDEAEGETEESKLLIYRFEDEDEDNFRLDLIEDDDEFDRVCKEFESRASEQDVQ